MPQFLQARVGLTVISPLRKPNLTWFCPHHTILEAADVTRPHALPLLRSLRPPDRVVHVGQQY